jgi:transposase
VSLENKIDQLFKEISGLKESVNTLTRQNVILSKKVSELEGKNQTLTDKLHKKNSRNSSVPPSKDENRVKPNQSLRNKTGKKSGGQKGHSGKHLKLQDNPDEIIDHKSKYCTCCGDKLSDHQELVSKRQVVDLPPIQAIIIEHRQYKIECRCGHINKSAFPKAASSPISYGNTIETMIGYLSVRQYMSMERISEFFSQVYNTNLSQGTIANKINSFSSKCIPIYDLIRSRIETSLLVGSDETGCVVNGEKHWMWTWQNEKMTFIAPSKTRGYQAIIDNFPKGFVNGILVSDCWAAQLKTPAVKHQICLAHLLREIKYFVELGHEKWSAKFEKLIYKALKLRKSILENPNISFVNQKQEIKKTCSKLINQEIKAPKKLLALKKRLKKLSDSIWTFLENSFVPPDNNGSERAIRNIKVKQKISGQFRSSTGAQHFAIIRSVLDTINKNGGRIFNSFADIASLVPE